MTNLIPLAEALALVREQHRDLLDAAMEWQEGSEQQTDPDHFALICVGADASYDDVGPTLWRRTTVYDVLRFDIPNWCSPRRCLEPRGLPQAMWQWFDFLDHTGRFDPAGDPVGELRKPLLCYGGLDTRGRPRPAGTPSPIVCECYVPYRETAEILLELVQEEERGGPGPLKLLRMLVGRRSGPPPGWWEEWPP